MYAAVQYNVQFRSQTTQIKTVLPLVFERISILFPFKTGTEFKNDGCSNKAVKITFGGTS